MRFSEIQFWTDWDYQVGVHCIVAAIVVSFVVVDVDSVADTWQLINVSSIGPQVWVIDYAF